MPVCNAVLLKEPLISSGSDYSLVGDLRDPDIAVGAGILHGDAPVRSIRLRAEHLHVSAEADHAGGDAGIPKRLHDHIARVALSNAAEIDLHALGQRDRAGVRTQGNATIVHMFQQRRKLRIIGNPVFARREAPCAQNRIDGNVEHAVCLRAPVQSVFQKRLRIGRK